MKIEPIDDEPHLAGAGVSIGRLVRTAYEESFEAAQSLAVSALSLEVLKEAIDYCADEACERDGVSCVGCRKRTERDGFATLDDYCRAYERITCRATGLVLSPGGPRPQIEVESFDALAATWSGEKSWYLARRLVRRLKKRQEPRPKRMTRGIAAGDGSEATTAAPVTSPAVILVRPQLADNIGMAARAMANFGLEEMRLVAPRDGWPNEKARFAASGADFIVEEARASTTLREAVGDLNWLAATTARQRHLSKPVMTPAQAAEEMHRRLLAGQRCGILFGPEREGLENDEVALADAVVMVPVDPRFASLNLAQAVLLFGYEWMGKRATGTLGRVTTYERPVVPGTRDLGSPPATKEELLALFEHLESELDAKGFLHPPHKRPTMVRNIRTMLTRMHPSEQDVRTLRGMVKVLVHGKRGGRSVP